MVVVFTVYGINQLIKKMDQFLIIPVDGYGIIVRDMNKLANVSAKRLVIFLL